MSALRETMGVATALERRVAVTSQEASSAVTPRIPGNPDEAEQPTFCISNKCPAERQDCSDHARGRTSPRFGGGGGRHGLCGEG